MPRRSARTLWAAKLAGRDVEPSAETLRAMGAREPFHGIVLGIDPSLRGTGLGVVEFAGAGNGRLLFSRTVRAPAKASAVDCLGHIARAVAELLDRYTVRHVAVEETIYVQNFRTAQILGTARGAAIAPAAMRGTPVFEYPPLRVKQAVAGFGRASKEQVAGQLRGILKLDAALGLDETDAAAVALCHALTFRQ